MPGRDSYYSSLAKPKDPNQTAMQGMDSGAPSTGSVGITSSQTPGYQQAQGGGSPYDAGSGFVNLSHLLALNGASGTQSAGMAANQVKDQGKAAQGAIQSAEDKYNSQVSKAQVRSEDFASQSDPHGSGRKDANNGLSGAKPVTVVKNALDQANAGYQGPNSLADDPGYAKLSKQVSQAQSRAQNATSGNGEAAQISQDTGLSPRQAAASAFYQGVTNAGLQSAGSKYKGLGGMLDAANDRSVKASDLARQVTANSAGPLADQYKKLDNFYNGTGNVTIPSVSDGVGPTVLGTNANHHDENDTVRNLTHEEKVAMWGYDPDEPGAPGDPGNY